MTEKITAKELIDFLQNGINIGLFAEDSIVQINIEEGGGYLQDVKRFFTVCSYSPKTGYSPEEPVLYIGKFIGEKLLYRKALEQIKSIIDKELLHKVGYDEYAKQDREDRGC